MKKIIKLNIVTIIALVLLFSAGCYLLLQENRFNISIASIITSSHHLNVKEHLLVLALLPVYVGAIVFGAAFFGIYLGSRAQRFLSRFYSKKQFMQEKKASLGDLPSCM